MVLKKCEVKQHWAYNHSAVCLPHKGLYKPGTQAYFQNNIQKKITVKLTTLLKTPEVTRLKREIQFLQQLLTPASQQLGLL